MKLRILLRVNKVEEQIQKQEFVESLLCARHCPRRWIYNNEQTVKKPWSHGVYTLVGGCVWAGGGREEKQWSGEGRIDNEKNT